MRRSRGLTVFAVVALALAGSAGVLTLAGAVHPPAGWLRSDGEPAPSSGGDRSPSPSPSTSTSESQSESPSGAPEPTATAPEALALPTLGDPAAVLGAAEGPALYARAVRAAVRPLLKDPDLRRHTGLIVRDLGRDREVLTTGGTDPYIPASTLKLLTAAAALSALGPDEQFETRVVSVPGRVGGGAGRGPTVVLVGGGDPLLASTAEAAEARSFPSGATIAGLAARTARTLASDGVRKVRIGYDDHLFSGLAAARTWEPSYVPDGVVSPVSALMVDGGGPGGTDPAQVAAAAFESALRSHGIAVSGGTPRAVRAADDARSLAETSSAALEDIVEYVLQVSDNEGAESLLRHVGLATDRAGSFAGGTAGVHEVLTGLGVPLDRVEMFDGSGLSRDDRVSLEAIGEIVQLGADPDHPGLRVLTTGLPVAHFSGSLTSRFADPAASAARGLVRAKTGTLSRAHGLAGTTVTRSGTLVGFAVLTDHVKLRNNLDSQQRIEQVVAALAGCGCRG